MAIPPIAMGSGRGMGGPGEGPWIVRQTHPEGLNAIWMFSIPIWQSMASRRRTCPPILARGRHCPLGSWNQSNDHLLFSVSQTYMFCFAFSSFSDFYPFSTHWAWERNSAFIFRGDAQFSPDRPSMDQSLFTFIMLLKSFQEGKCLPLLDDPPFNPTTGCLNIIFSSRYFHSEALSNALAYGNGFTANLKHIGTKSQKGPPKRQCQSWSGDVFRKTILIPNWPSLRKLIRTILCELLQRHDQKSVTTKAKFRCPPGRVGFAPYGFQIGKLCVILYPLFFWTRDLGSCVSHTKIRHS